MENLINKINQWFDKITGIAEVKNIENDIQESIARIDTFRADYRDWLSDNNIYIKGLNK